MPLLPLYVTHTLLNVACQRLGWRDRAARYPIDCCYLVTWRCNLTCAYCYESASVRGPASSGELDTAGVLKALAGIRTVCDILVLSGGEPTTRPDLEEILAACRELSFRQIVLNTNGVQLPRRLEALKHVHQVLVGLNTLHEGPFVAITRGTREQFRSQMENLETYLALRAEHGFDLALSSVIVPGFLGEVQPIVDWCVEHGAVVAFSPHVTDLRIDPRLKDDPAYRALADHLLVSRRRGLPLMGAPSYYRGIRDLGAFDCAPMANLTVNPNGAIRWPCGEGAHEGPSFAEGRPFAEMVADARSRHGGVPGPGNCDGRCHFGCRLALSSLVNHPWELPGEALHLLERQAFGA